MNRCADACQRDRWLVASHRRMSTICDPGPETDVVDNERIASGRRQI